MSGGVCSVSLHIDSAREKVRFGREANQSSRGLGIESRSRNALDEFEAPGTEFQLIQGGEVGRPQGDWCDSKDLASGLPDRLDVRATRSEQRTVFDVFHCRWLATNVVEIFDGLSAVIVGLVLVAVLALLAAIIVAVIAMRRDDALGSGSDAVR